MVIAILGSQSLNCLPKSVVGKNKVLKTDKFFINFLVAS